MVVDFLVAIIQTNLCYFLTDIDECREAAIADPAIEICGEDNTQCKNTEGSFKCVCVDGYQKNQMGKCKRK